MKGKAGIPERLKETAPEIAKDLETITGFLGTKEDLLMERDDRGLSNLLPR